MPINDSFCRIEPNSFHRKRYSMGHSSPRRYNKWVAGLNKPKTFAVKKPLPLGTPHPDHCPDCLCEMLLRTGRNGLFYACGNYPNCRNTAGSHDDGRPKGTPADNATKQMRVKAHDAFDQLWKTGMRTRPGAYGWLAKKMGLTKDECHIGMMDAVQCQAVIDLVATQLPSILLILERKN